MQRSRGTAFVIGVAAVALVAVAALTMNVVDIVRAGAGGSAGAPSVPSVMSYQGLLTDPDTGQAVADGTYNMSFIIYDAPAGGSIVWEEPAVGSIPISVTGGLFTHLLGSSEPLTAGVFGAGDTYLQVFVNGETLLPRQQIATVAYALVAQEAANAAAIDGLDRDGLDSRFVNNRGGDFPRPNYDSGFTAIAQGDVELFTHDLGGDPDNYFVDLQCRDTTGFFPPGINNIGIGGDNDGAAVRGAYWLFLSDTIVGALRNADDNACKEVRVRIWVMPPLFIIPPIIIVP